VVEGFTVQPMAERPHAHELIVGASVDALFGPVLLFGQGGTAVEVVADRAVALPPLNRTLAADLIARTRVARLLAGWRHRPAADAAAIEGVLVALSQLLVDLPEVVELDINPLWADEHGVLALDARVRVQPAAPGRSGSERFAIRPYPSEWVRTLRWAGRELVLRPIRPDDEAQHRAFIECLTPQDVRLRIFHARRDLPRSELARLTQIDYEREMAFVAVDEQAEGGAQTLGVARAICDPDNTEAEFAVIVRSDLKGQGLGRLLMQALIEHTRQRGTQRLVGDVLQENAGMLALARQLGFHVERQPGDAGVLHVVLALQPTAR
jgi:acetyltransferase